MSVGKRNDQSIIATVARAIDLSEEALGQVARIAVEGIRSGLEVSSHVEAAEREMRSALRQLVLAERELHSGLGLGAHLDEPRDGFADVAPGSGADALHRGT
jgi:hypothetical protein